MEHNIVKKSFFSYNETNFSRLDPEFAMPSLMKEEDELKLKAGSKIQSLVDEYDGPVINDSFTDEDNLVKYIAIDSIDIDDGLTYSDEIYFKDRPSRARYQVKTGDILVSNVRPNRGAIAMITKRNSDNLASSGFTLLRKKLNSKVCQEFIFAFLKSEFGKKQLMRRNRGSMYPAVVEADVLDVWIPSPPPEIHDEIVSDVKKALKCQDDFFALTDTLTELLNQLLLPYGAPPSPLEGVHGVPNHNIVSNRDFFDKAGANRFDADFFRDDYRIFDQRCQQLGDSFLLDEYYETFGGRGLGEDISDVPYIKQAVLTNAGINWSAVSYERGDFRSETGRVKTRDILIACTAHEIYYVGRKVDYVRSIPEEIKDTNVCVADILILRPKLNLPNEMYGPYIAAFLRSPSGLHQVQRCIRGLRGGHIYGCDISRYVRVPRPSNEWIEEFGGIAKQAEEKRNESKETMNLAFQKITNFTQSLINQNIKS